MRYNWWHFWFRSNFTTQKKKTHDFRFDVYTRKKLWRWFLVGRRGTSKQFTLNSVSIQIDNWFIFWFLCQTNILLIHFTNILDRNIGIFVDWQMVLHRLYSKANIFKSNRTHENERRFCDILALLLLFLLFNVVLVTWESERQFGGDLARLTLFFEHKK